MLGLLGLGACGRPDLPDMSLTAGPRGIFEDKVWMDQDPAAPAGSFRAFLSDGTLIMASCVETYRLAAWRRIDDTKLVWEEGGRLVRAEVAVLGARELALVIETGDGPLSQSFRAAAAPVVCSGAAG